MNRGIRLSGLRHLPFVAGFGAAAVMGIGPVQAQELCGGVDYPFPYTDVSGVGAAFCPGIMEAYVTGVSKGTTPTTFSPDNTVTRVQMTTFLQRSLDQGLARTNRRAVLNRWWAPQTTGLMQSIALASVTNFCAFDGENIWTTTGLGQVVQVQASTGKVVGTWTGANIAQGILVAAGKVYVAGLTSPGNLYVVDSTQVPGAVMVAASSLGNGTSGVASDGTHIWTTNIGGSVSIITPQAALPYPATTVTTGFNAPYGILFDGANMWVTDAGVAGKLLKLDGLGGIVQTVAVGSRPANPVFDGANIWVPNNGDNSITVVQASTGNVVATISTDVNNHLNSPVAASFDGERILVTNSTGDSVTLFKAADLSFIANVPTGPSTFPFDACSDGINFWVTLQSKDDLLRF
jgi:hypothetical protein